VRSSRPAQECCFSRTTTNEPALDEPVGETEALEIIDRVVSAVRAALER
jgi:hypothetical protein